jgi:ClpP class serine protease
MVLDIANRETDIEAVSAKLGKPLSNARKVEIRGSVAVIPIVGTIVRYSSLFTDICGGVSTEILAKDLQVALEDDSIKTIIFNIDSPGGEAAGIAELSDMIVEARAKKKIIAYVDDMAASAGYWLASACEEIYASKTAMVGSIGVVFTLRENKDSGIEIVSNVSPLKRPDISTEQGISQIQAWADKLGEIFVDSVALNRGVSSDTVLSKYGKGDMLVGREALEAGMIDSITHFEALIAKNNLKG